MSWLVGVMKGAAWVLFCLMTQLIPALAQTASFVAPPRSINDITAILDQEKPDLSRTGKLNKGANAEPPASMSASALAEFLL